MRRHAKASAAQSIHGTGEHRGQIGRSVAMPAASLGIDGSGAPSRRSHRALFPTLLLTAFAAALLLASAASAQRGTTQVIDTGATVFGIAVNDTTGNLYAVTNSDIKVYNPSGTLQFEFGASAPSGNIAIDQPTGDVYVLEKDNNRVAKYNAAGKFLFYFGWNVNLTQVGSAPEVCPRAGFPGDVCQAGESRSDPGALGYAGTGPEGTTNPAVPAQGIAVGPDGSVYVSEPGYSNVLISGITGNRRIQVFAPSGAFLSKFSQPLDPVGCDPSAVSSVDPTHACFSDDEPFQIALDSQGTIYTTPDPRLGPAVFNNGPGCSDKSPSRVCAVRLFTSSGSSLGDFAPSHVFGRPFQVAIDQSNGHVYVYQASGPDQHQYEIAVYDSTGNPIEEVGLGLPLAATNIDFGAGTSGLAVRDGTSRAYAADGTNRVFVLDNLTSVPTATVDTVTTKNSNSATFTGTANPNSPDFNAGYHFEYRAEGNANWTPVSSSDTAIGSGTSDVPATQDATGLDPNTTYHVRLVVTRELGAGSAKSSEVIFTTDHEPPAISLVGASRVSDTTARLGALIDPRHASTNYYFKYGTDTGYGSFAPVGQNGDAGQGLGGVPAFQEISGLTPDTTYHYCILAENIGGQSPCEDHTFTTTTTAAQDWPQRRFELVNEPDKGNQSVLPAIQSLTFQTSAKRFMTADGNRIAWSTVGGTPDSSSGFLPFFISHRTPGGWITEPFAPTPDQQPQDGHAGEITYTYITANPSLTRFMIGALGGGGPVGGVADYLIRADSPADQTVLAFSPYNGRGGEDPSTSSLFSDDLSRVVFGGQLLEGSSNTNIDVPACGRGQFTVTPTHVFYSSPGDNDCGAPAELYATDFATNTPILISGPALDSQQGATLIGVKADGSEAMFMTKSQLVGQDTDTATDFYLWSRDGSALQCLTCDVSGFVATGAAKASSDFSRVYYQGSDGIYVLRTPSAEIHLIGTASEILGDTARFTPDGRVVVFPSHGGATPEPVTVSEKPQDPGQLIRYDDSTESLECVSCQDSGGQTARMAAVDSNAGNVALSADGDSVAFSTTAALTSRDINGLPDVYEWHNGVVRLVTDGVHEWPSNILGGVPTVWGFSGDGRHLFLSVGGFRLTGEEHDFYANLYDAHVGGGFPVPTPPAHCTEDACQGPLQGAPPLDVQGSSTFNGPANPAVVKAHKRKKHHKRRHHRASRNTRSTTRSHG